MVISPPSSKVLCIYIAKTNALNLRSWLLVLERLDFDRLDVVAAHDCNRLYESSVICEIRKKRNSEVRS